MINMKIYTEHVGLIIDKDLKEKIQNLAKINNRTFSYIIRTILEEYFEEE